MDAIFDRAALLAHKKRALRQFGTSADFLLSAAANDLALRLSTVGRSFASALVIHGLTADIENALAATGKVETVTRIEPAPEFLGSASGVTGPLDPISAAPESHDLAVSLYTLSEVDDLPGMLIQIRRVLRPDGLFLGCLPGVGTLKELRDCLLTAEIELRGGATARIHPFTDVRDAGALLQRAGFALPVADTEEVTVRYADMFALMRDLRAMGMTNGLLGSRPASLEIFVRAAQIYAERYADGDGRIRATFSTVWLSGWAPHQSQQKPLRPGSAKMSLADALARNT